MDLHLIPVLKDDVQVSRVKTPESLRTVVYVSSKGRKITPNEAMRDLITLCDGTHTLKEIVTYFVKISGENPPLIEEQLEPTVETLLKNEVITLCEVPTPKEIPQVVELVLPLEKVVMEITDSCNLNCLHCYNDSGRKWKDELTLEEIYQLIDETKRLGVLSVHLSGGEPLVHPHFFEIAEYIRDHSLGLEVFTNGTLVTKKVAKKLKDFDVLKVSVSLDSLTPEIHDSFRGKKGAWKKTMKGINNLKKVGVRIEPAVALSQLNAKEVIPLCEFFFKEGIHTYRFMAVFSTGRKTPLAIGITPDELEKACKTIFMWQKNHNITYDPLIEQERPNCGIGSVSLAVKSNGDATPCSAFGRTLTLGNIRDQSLKSMWNDSPLLNMLRNLDAAHHPVCGTCDLLHYCNGGCIANTCVMRGEPQLYDPFTCAYRRAQKHVQNLEEG